MSVSPPVVRASVGVIGDAEVGKSALLKAFEQKHFFQHEYRMTQGAQVYVQSVDVKDSRQQTQQASKAAAAAAIKARVELYATEVGGHPLFTGIRDKLLSQCPYVLACFDVTRLSTLQSLGPWLKAYRRSLAVPFEFGLLVACKADRRADGEVSMEEGQQKAQQLGLDYVEVSAANGDGVDKAFERIASHVSQRVESRRATHEDVLQPEQQQEEEEEEH